MGAKLLPVLLPLLVLPQLDRAADRQWVLEQSTITYHVSHPLHQTEGVSHAAKGKGVCHAGQCDFLVAVPVKSFDSGDSNRDLHMLQATRGAQFPMVTVRTRLTDETIGSATIHADLEIQFAGQTAQYKQIPLQVVTQSNAYPNLRDYSGDTLRFQDRSAVAFSDPHQERNPGACRDDLAAAMSAHASFLTVNFVK